MKAGERERQDWAVVILILIMGLLLVTLAGQWALRFSSIWQMDTSMESNIDPNREFLTSRPNGFIEQIDAAILTQPSWINDFLTPGVSLMTRTPFPPQTPTLFTTPTSAPASTNTVAATKSPTSTVVYFPATYTPTSRPKSTATNTSTALVIATSTTGAPPTITSRTATATGTPDLTRTFTATATQTATFTASATTTATASATATSTPTATQTSVPYPPEIGTTPDGVVYILPTGGSLTLNINLIANGDSSYDFAYYERREPAGTGIFLDWIIVEIGDGTSWYTVFNWGDNLADTNSNMDFNILPNPQTPEEADQRYIPTASLYNNSGIVIDVDAIVPPGIYPYLRFSAPPGDSDGHTEIDAVEIFP